MTNKPVVIVGMGEMGGVFARGFLRSGYPVFPVTRQMNASLVAEELPDPELVLLAVAEADFAPVIEGVPDVWRDRLVLLQNELLPKDWQSRGLEPTVISVWFEKKKGRDVKVLIPSPVYGPKAQLIADSLGAIGIPTRVLNSADELLFELVRKNVYILTTNIAGLRTGGTVGGLRARYPDIMNAVAGDVLDIQAYLTGAEQDRPKLIEGMLEAFDGDPEHNCTGRSALARLTRALKQADEGQLRVPALRQIQEVMMAQGAAVSG